MLKLVLKVGATTYELLDRPIADYLKNWDEIEVSESRADDFSGVMRGWANKFEFAVDAARIIETEYLANGILGAVSIAIYDQAPISRLWELLYEVNIDMSTYETDGMTVKVAAKNDDIYHILDSQKSQVFDIAVSDIKDAQQLYYDRMKVNNKVSFHCNGEVDDDDSYGKITYGADYDMQVWHYSNFSVTWAESRNPVKGYLEPFDGQPFFVALKSATFHWRAKFSMIITDQWSAYGGTGSWLRFAVKKKGATTYEPPIKEYFFPKTVEAYQDVYVDVDVPMEEGDEGHIYFETNTYEEWTWPWAWIKNYEEVSVSYLGRNAPVFIDVFTPSALLTKILEKMQIPATGVIETGDLPIPRMMAAESVRGMEDAKVHTSFAKFAEWMQTVFGYEYDLANGYLTFRDTRKYFDNTQKKELEYVSGFQLSVNEGLIYTGVDVGYEKKEYDQINGRDEFHVTNSFTTGITASKDNILKIISPYRCDPYGIEFLAVERDEKTKDKKDDKDLFFVDVAIDGSNRLVPNRNYNIQNVLSDTIFNAIYSPRHMLMANIIRIAPCASKLTFTASEGNADVIINGSSEKAEVTILTQDKVFRVEYLQIETPGLRPFGEMESYKGLIVFDYLGHKYQGYIRDITMNLGRPQSTTYELVCRAIDADEPVPIETEGNDFLITEDGFILTTEGF